MQESILFQTYVVGITYPIEDAKILELFHTAVTKVKRQGRNAKLAVFDTVLTFPGERFPWERLVQVCKNYGILSLIDSAHGIGHIDLGHLGQIQPDFFVSNCYKYVNYPHGFIYKSN
jgi:selenocysteine lyase/cysteine desulfurase